MNPSTDNCFHCGNALGPEREAVATPAGTAQVCSQPCATAVKAIYDSGLADFYEHRAAPAAGHTHGDTSATDWRTYERPAVMREFVRPQDDGTLIADLLVQGVHCAACTWLIENTLQKSPGVIAVSVNPVTTRAELHWNPEQASLADLLAQIAAIGYLPTPFTEHASYAAGEREHRLALRRLLVAGLGMMQVTSYAVALYAGAFQGMDPAIEEFLRYISLLVATPIVLYSGAPFFAGAWRNLRGRQLGMDVPVALAIGAAWSASVWNTFAGSGEVFFDSATMFIFFLSGTRYLESAGRRRALDLTGALAQHIPSTATRLSAGGAEEVGVMELDCGDRVRVVQGSAFPADGVLEDGATRVDESMLTGESTPVRRVPGDAVVAGTINLENTTTMRIEKTGADTVLAQIGRLVTLAGTEKPQLVQLTDRVASVFVAAVLLIAMATAVGWFVIDSSRVFEIVLTVLVVTCPCALALATPAAFTVATSALARRGFLLRRSGALQNLANVTEVVFDKTGTLTRNAIEISQTETLGDSSADEVLAMAAALESHSAHPIARAFRNHGSPQVHAIDTSYVAGGGLTGRIDDRKLRIGSLEFVTALSERPADCATPDDSKRRIYLGDTTGLLACFELTEELRGGADTLFTRLAEQGIGTSLASGDQPAAVRQLAEQLQAGHWQAAMLPEDKLQRVRALQAEGAVVAVVGDGINDAPVLAGANVSIAMGSGTSLAQHSADCVWLGAQLHGLEDAFSTARRTMRIVRQNLAWALAYNTLAIPLAVTGSIEPWMAALGMSLSSLLVMLNALRLGRGSANIAPTKQGEQQSADTAAPAKPGCCSKASAAA